MFLDAGVHRGRGELAGKRGEIFLCIRCARGNINERADLGIGTRITDDGPAIGMTDQHGRTILPSECAFCGRDIVGNRG